MHLTDSNFLQNNAFTKNRILYFFPLLFKKCINFQHLWSSHVLSNLPGLALRVQQKFGDWLYPKQVKPAATHKSEHENLGHFPVWTPFNICLFEDS